MKTAILTRSAVGVAVAVGCFSTLQIQAAAETTSGVAAPTISEYTNGLPSSAAPTSIATGPEGNLWFTETSGSKGIGKITSEGLITSYTPSGSATPREITLGPEGDLWYTADGGSGLVGRLDPSTGEFHEYPLPGPGGNPVGITVGHEGDIWFAVEGPEALVNRIVPSSGEISEFKLPNKGSKPTQITVGREGMLWLTVNSPAAVGRFNPSTHSFSEYQTGLSTNSNPTGITTGPEGNVWFTESNNPGRIGRINPTSAAITEFSAGLTVGSPQDIVTGGDGDLYFTESNSGGAVGRMTPTGEVTEYTNGLAHNGQPWGIAAGPEGNIWFTAKANPAAIGVLALPNFAAPDPVTPVTTPLATPVVPSAPATVVLKPQLGTVAGVKPLAGTVLVKSRSGGFVALSGAANIPVGSVIDASNGKLELVTALPHGKSQAAALWGGVFQVGQSKSGNGLTRLTLTGTALYCPKHGLAHASSARHHASTRKLWATDNHGRYRSYGSSSATTVLGTEWETIDSCRGTTTRVRKGKVRVSDFPDHRTVVISAGHSFFADANG